jgi:hypothetical protein
MSACRDNIPRISDPDELIVHSCHRSCTQTIAAPRYSLSVTNPDGQVACILADDNADILYDDDGSSLCPDDV